MDRFVLNKKNVDEIGKKMAGFRTEEQISQEAVAVKMGKQQSYISSLENGHQDRIPSLRTLISYMDAVGYQVVIEKKIV